MRSSQGSAAFRVSKAASSGQVAQEAEDQLGGDAELGLGGLHRRKQPFDGDAERQAAVGVGLGIEHDLRVAAPSAATRLK
jgi:hypothetical protein